MVKKAGGYTSQMKARVKYPKMKSKSAKKMDEVKVISSTKVEDITTAQNESIKDEDVASDDSATVEDIQIVREAASSSEYCRATFTERCTECRVVDFNLFI